MLSPAFLFSICNALALLGWAALALGVFVPKTRGLALIIAGLALPLMFSLVYVGALAAGFGGGAQGGFGSIEAVRALFANDHALLAGWVHYLAFDLMVGALLARDAARADMPALVVVPCFVLTFLFGPSGLLVYAIARLSLGRGLKEIWS